VSISVVKWTEGLSVQGALQLLEGIQIIKDKATYGCFFYHIALYSRIFSLYYRLCCAFCVEQIRF
jgi:hypothetical protein